MQVEDVEHASARLLLVLAKLTQALQELQKEKELLPSEKGDKDKEVSKDKHEKEKHEKEKHEKEKHRGNDVVRRESDVPAGSAVPAGIGASNEVWFDCAARSGATIC